MRSAVSTILFLIFLIGCSEDQTTESIDAPKSIELISPIGGEIYTVYDTILIKWKSESVDRLEIKTNYGELIAQQVDAEKVSEIEYEVTKKRDFQIRIEDIFNRSANDETDTIFVTEKSLILLEPNMSFALPADSTLKIIWEYHSPNEENIRILLSFNDGKSWTTIIENIDAGVGEYIFENEDGIFSNKCRVKIEGIRNPKYIDISDEVFAFFDPQQFDPNYFPLEIGNAWNWERIRQSSCMGEFQSDTSFFKEEIIGKEELEGNEYLKVQTIIEKENSVFSYYRIEQEDGFVYMKDNTVSEEIPLLKLSLPTGSYVIEKSYDPDYNRTVKIYEDAGSLFQQDIKYRHYQFHHWISGNVISLGYDLGITGRLTFDDQSSTTDILLGCVIDGSVYGDTVLTF